jgi:murein L,D-transpeptidase YcbB/YkuD
VYRNVIISGMLWLLVGCSGHQTERPLLDWEDRCAQLLRGHVRRGGVLMGGTSLPIVGEVSTFYQQRAQRLAWSGPRGPGAQADLFIQLLARAEENGLDGREYHRDAISALLNQWRKPEITPPDQEALVALDVLLSNAFIRYGGHLLRGRVDPRTVHDFWDAPYVRGGMVDLLQTALDLQQIRPVLERLHPPQTGYKRLQQALLRHLDIARSGGWPHVGSSGEGLRARLERSGDWPADSGDQSAALRRFQRRRHLEPSGQLNAETRAALEEPIAEQIAQIELNMERWRWLPHDADARYVLVRLDDYEVDFIDRGTLQFTGRTIVGKAVWRTPIFSAQMTHLVFNPYWYIPRSIARNEILPLLQRDPSYAQRVGLRMSRGDGVGVQSIDPQSINWAQMTPALLDVNMAQVPGGSNPLGAVKFIFYNPYDIYLHDTPNKALFNREKREFSHGCIRVEHSIDLAQAVLEEGDRSEIDALVASGENRQINLEKPLSVFLLYWTAWVDDEGVLHLRDDVYGSDAALRDALAESNF